MAQPYAVGTALEMLDGIPMIVQAINGETVMLADAEREATADATHRTG
ncbi:MAG: hypothetical protein J6C15_10240 [Bacteroidaceae bacterium]|nr:hypothetical protein [Bacteroidaceae bacterium]